MSSTNLYKSFQQIQLYSPYFFLLSCNTIITSSLFIEEFSWQMQFYRESLWHKIFIHCLNMPIYS